MFAMFLFKSLKNVALTLCVYLCQFYAVFDTVKDGDKEAISQEQLFQGPTIDAFSKKVPFNASCLVPLLTFLYLIAHSTYVFYEYDFQYVPYEMEQLFSHRSIPHEYKWFLFIY